MDLEAASAHVAATGALDPWLALDAQVHTPARWWQAATGRRMSPTHREAWLAQGRQIGVLCQEARRVMGTAMMAVDTAAGAGAIVDANVGVLLMQTEISDLAERFFAPLVAVPRYLFGPVDRALAVAVYRALRELASAGHSYEAWAADYPSD